MHWVAIGVLLAASLAGCSAHEGDLDVLTDDLSVEAAEPVPAWTSPASRERSASQRR